MLTILGQPQRFCDGVSRRSFLKIGAFAFGAYHLSLADVLRAESQADFDFVAQGGHQYFPRRRSAAPGHVGNQDRSPAEIRGEFKPIATKVPGIQIGEVFPQIAAMADKFAFIRSVVGAAAVTMRFQCMTGWPTIRWHRWAAVPASGPWRREAARAGRSVGAAVRRPGRAGPAHAVERSRPHRLFGCAYGPFKPDGEGHGEHEIEWREPRSHGRPQDAAAPVSTTFAAKSMPAARCRDGCRHRARPRRSDVEQIDRRAGSPKESEKVRDRYGDGKPYKFQYDGAPTVNDHLLMARRLVEAGVAA